MSNMAVHYSSKTDDWATPQDFFDRLNREFHFTLDPCAYEWEFDEDLKFESCPHSGFRFGNEGCMVFVPCYSSQNGYYSTWIDIYYAPCWCGVLLDGGHVLGFNAKMEEC